MGHKYTGKLHLRCMQVVLYASDVDLVRHCDRNLTKARRHISTEVFFGDCLLIQFFLMFSEHKEHMSIP